MTEPVLYQRDGDIVLLTINRPDIRNAISDDGTIQAIVDAVTRLGSDAGVRAAVLTGAGTAFSSGGNLRKMAEDGIADQPPMRTRRTYTDGIQRIPLAFERLEVPVVAAVNGPAIGAGCDLACMCDIRIAGESASFAESFVKVGIVPGDGGAFLLQRVIGYAKASEMALTGDVIDARQALAIGLVSRVVPDADLVGEAMAIARRVAANPPLAVRLTKKLLREGYHQRLDSLLELSATYQALAHTTDDHREAVDAFLARRKPVFSGS